MDGDIDVEGMLRIDGDVRGSIRVTGKLVVGAAGRVQASIRARSAIIGGLVKGDVYVSEQLRLLTGGVIVGSVFAPRMEVEDGTVIHGYVAVNGAAGATEAGLRSFVENHGGDRAASRFLGRFRADSFASPATSPAASTAASTAASPAASPAASTAASPAATPSASPTSNAATNNLGGTPDGVQA